MPRYFAPPQSIWLENCQSPQPASTIEVMFSSLMSSSRKCRYFAVAARVEPLPLWPLPVESTPPKGFFVDHVEDRRGIERPDPLQQRSNAFRQPLPTRQWPVIKPGKSDKKVTFCGSSGFLVGE